MHLRDDGRSRPDPALLHLLGHRWVIGPQSQRGRNRPTSRPPPTPPPSMLGLVTVAWSPARTRTGLAVSAGPARASAGPDGAGGGVQTTRLRLRRPRPCGQTGRAARGPGSPRGHTPRSVRRTCLRCRTITVAGDSTSRDIQLGRYAPIDRVARMSRISNGP